MFNLLNERTSAFEHTLWDRYSYLTLMHMSAAVRQADQTSLRDLGYSTAQDAFYSLLGCEVKPNTALDLFWQQAAQTPDYPALLRLFKQGQPAAQQEAVLALAAAAQRCLRPDPAANEPATEGSRPEESADLPDGDDAPGVLATRAKFAFSEEDARARAAGIEVLSSFLTDAGPTERLRVATELAAAQSIDVRALSNMLGWATKIVSGAARHSRAVAGELTGYRPNGWTDRTRQDEMLGIADGDPITMARMAEGSLTNREYRQDTPLGKGPVVLLRDESTSMTDQPNPQLPVSRSLEVALAHAFNREKRDLVSIAWSTLGIRKFTYGEPGVAEHLSRFLGGSTRIERALNTAIETCEDYVAGSDILIVTDGLLHTSPAETPVEFVARMSQSLERFRGRVWLVVVGAADERELRETCGWVDGWIRIDRLGTGTELSEMLANVATHAAPARRLL